MARPVPVTKRKTKVLGSQPSDGAVDFVFRRSLRRSTAASVRARGKKGTKPHWCSEALSAIG